MHILQCEPEPERTSFSVNLSRSACPSVWHLWDSREWRPVGTEEPRCGGHRGAMLWCYLSVILSSHHGKLWALRHLPDGKRKPDTHTQVLGRHQMQEASGRASPLTRCLSSVKAIPQRPEHRWPSASSTGSLLFSLKGARGGRGWGE